MDRVLDSRRRLALVLGEPSPWVRTPPGPRADEPPPLADAPTVPLPVSRAPVTGRWAAAVVWCRRLVRGRAGTAVRRWVPEGVRGARVDPGRPGAVALTVVAAVAAIAAAVGVWIDRPRAEPVPPAPITGLAALAPTPAATEPGGPIVVSVTGKVVRPGLVRVADGARVADVVEAAGGPAPGTDLTSLNLARKVGDGEQVVVGLPAPAPGADTPAAGAAAPEAAVPGGKVDLNRATLAQLDGLPGVGPVTAQRILEWRTRNGRFARVDQLREVEGIGERRFSQLRDLVVAG